MMPNVTRELMAKLGLKPGFSTPCLSALLTSSSLPVVDLDLI